MFGKLVENATGSLGKSFTVVGLLPALVLLLGIATIFKGPGEVPVALGLLEKGIDVARTAWFILALFAAGIVFFALRGYLVYFQEELPGGLFNGVRNWLVRHAIAGRSGQEGELEKLECAYTALTFFAEAQTVVGYIPPAITDPELETVREAWKKAYSTLDRIADAYPNGPSSVSAEKADEIERGILLLYVFGSRHPDEPFVLEALASWRAFIGKKNASATACLTLVKDDCQRRIAVIVLRLYELPIPRWTKPTDFGNCASALADYADKRYGIDTAVLWDRLWWVLPDGDRKEIAESRVMIETLTALSSCFWFLFGISTTVLLVKLMSVIGIGPGLQTATHGLELLVFSVCFAIAAYFWYRLSVTALQGLVQRIKPLVDVYRLKLLKTLGHVVTTVAEERKIYAELGDFLLQAKPLADDRKIVMDAKPAAKEREVPDD
jgi:hypothetical protein